MLGKPPVGVYAKVAYPKTQMNTNLNEYILESMWMCCRIGGWKRFF
jgi:hypothetical protein